MVSMVETGASKDNDTPMDTVVPKTEPTQDGPGSMSSSVSTPEPEAETLTQDVAQTQKRKGGRKPVRRPIASRIAFRGFLCDSCADGV